MHTLKIIINRGWYPALITVLAVLGILQGWPVEWITPALIFILALGLVVAVIKARERQLERAVFRLRQLSEYFYRRFMGDSTLSIFVIIDSLFNIDNPKLWEKREKVRRTFNRSLNRYVKKDILRIYINDEAIVDDIRFNEFLDNS